MRIRIHRIIAVLVLALGLQGCDAPPSGVEVADSRTASDAGESTKPAADSSPAANSSSSASDESSPATNTSTNRKPAATSSGGRRKRTPQFATAGMGGAGGASANKPASQENAKQNSESGTPESNSASNSASASEDSNSQNSNAENQSSNGSSQSSYGRSGPPSGSNYGNSSGSSNGRRSGPPEGSNYGNYSRPSDARDPYSGRGGSNSYGSSRSNQERGNSGSGGQSPPNQGGGSMQVGGIGGGSGGSTMSPGAIGGVGNNGGGQGGNSMQLDGIGGGNNSSGNNFSSNRNSNPEPAKAAVEETSFFNMAINQFAAGNDLAGTKLLQAELIGNRSRFDDFPLSFWREAKEPTLGLRMGIGVNFVAVGDFSGKPPVLGDPAPEVNRNSGRGGRSGGIGGVGGPSSGGGISSAGGRGQGGPPSDAEGILKYYSGDITDEILEQFEERFSGSPARFGAVLAGLDVRPVLNMEELVKEKSGGSGSRGRSPNMMGMNQGGGSSSGYGRGNQNSPAYGFHAGLVFLGEGDLSDLEKKAEEEQLDGYIVIKQKAQMNRRTGQATSETKAEFYLAGKRRGDTKTLFYQIVAGKRSQGEEPVKEEISKLFEKKVDRYCTVIDFPTLTEEQCVGRLDSIAEESKSDPLPYLLEANFYVHKGWLNEDLAQEKIIALIGEENALKVFSADFEEQKVGLKKWLPK